MHRNWFLCGDNGLVMTFMASPSTHNAQTHTNVSVDRRTDYATCRRCCIDKLFPCIFLEQRQWESSAEFTRMIHIPIRNSDLIWSERKWRTMPHFPRTFNFARQLPLALEYRNFYFVNCTNARYNKVTQMDWKCMVHDIRWATRVRQTQAQSILPNAIDILLLSVCVSKCIRMRTTYCINVNCVHSESQKGNHHHHRRRTLHRSAIHAHTTKLKLRNKKNNNNEK